MPAVPRPQSQPQSQEDILAAGLTSLAEHDLPPDDRSWAWLDPDCGPPLELADVTFEELEKLTVAGPARVAEALPAGVLPRDGSGGGSGFADGGVLDVLAPGVTLAGFADQAHARLAGADDDELGGVSDDELIGVLRAWRRLVSWAQARELAAIAELARRRPAPGTPPAPPSARGAPPGAPRPFPRQLSEFIADEIAPALTLTRMTADADLALALDLARRLPRTAAALEAGQIDLAKAKVIAAATGTLTDEHAAAVEAAVLPDAAQQTTGQLRAAVTRAVMTVDPAATRKRREEAERCARVECWTDPAGTATLAGRYLPAAETLAADRRICRIARAWKAYGAIGGADLLRARAYLALILGHDTSAPPLDLLPRAADPAPDDSAHPSSAAAPPGPAADSSCPAPANGSTPSRTPANGHSSAPNSAPGSASGNAPATGHDAATNSGGSKPGSQGCDRETRNQDPSGTATRNPGGPPVPPGLRTPGTGYGTGASPGGTDGLPLIGTIDLTVPLTTLLHLSDSPGDAAGYGPLDPDTTRALACAAAGHRATRWHLTITGPDDQAIGHGRTTAAETTPVRQGDASSGWTATVTAEPIATGQCEHRTREPGYRPSPALQRLIRARNTTCTAPGCRRPAVRCDLDHTVPHGQDGLTCECNLAALCRHHHRVKQAEGWTLQQTAPGTLTWTTPARRRYTTYPSKHPT